MIIINKLKLLFIRKKVEKLEINSNLLINRYGQLILNDDKPEIIDGVGWALMEDLISKLRDFYPGCIFTIVQNQFK